MPLMKGASLTMVRGIAGQHSLSGSKPTALGVLVMAGVMLLATISQAKQTAPDDRRTPARHTKAKPKKKPANKRHEADRVVVRWHSRATGGVKTPRFITARELAFEARVEALARGEAERSPYVDKHVQRALERHIAEVILASLPVDKAPTPKQVATQAENARLIIEQQVGGRAVLNKAASAEGISAEELNALLRRRARAGWYIDRMVTPMLSPSELELRLAHKRRQTPYSDQPFAKVVDALRRWWVSRELDEALTRYFRNVRGRVSITVIRG